MARESSGRVSRLSGVSGESDPPVENIHQGQLSNVGDVECPLEGRLDRRVVENGLAAQEHAEVSLFGRSEGLQRVGVCLDNVFSGGNPVVEDDHGTSISSSGIGSKGDRLQQVGRTIWRRTLAQGFCHQTRSLTSRDSGGRPHGTDQDYWLLAVDGGVH